MRAEQILIVQKPISQPHGIEIVKLADRPERFIPLGDSHARDITDWVEYPAEICTISKVGHGENIFSAIIEATQTKVWFKVSRNYSRLLTDTDRERRIIVTYRKEVNWITDLSPVVQAIQVSYDPILYAECIPLDAP